MFKTELTIEEESLLIQLLEDKKLSRAEILVEINSCCANTDRSEKEGLEIAKSLFNKIKGTSDFEYQEYINLISEE